MTDGEAIPGDPRLRWIAKASIVLGIVSLVRFAPELISVIPRNAKGLYFALVGLDLVIGAIWLKCGLALRKQGRAALGFAACGGAIIFAHAITSGIFVGKELIKVLSQMNRSSDSFFFMLTIAGTRFLIYGIEFLFWPCALMLLLKAAEDPEGNPSSRKSLLRSMIGAFLIGGLVQTMILAAIFDR